MNRQTSSPPSTPPSPKSSQARKKPSSSTGSAEFLSSAKEWVGHQQYVCTSTLAVSADRKGAAFACGLQSYLACSALGLNRK